MSEQFAGERDELRAVLASLAKVLGTVKGFVHENRATLGKDIKLLASLLERVDNQKDALGLVVQKGSLAMSNLALAFESGTGTYGSRVQITPGLQFRPDQFLCQTLVNIGTPEAVCTMLTDVLKPLLPATSGAAASVPSGQPENTTPVEPDDPRRRPRSAPRADCRRCSSCSEVAHEVPPPPPDPRARRGAPAERLRVQRHLRRAAPRQQGQPRQRVRGQR